jgi:hypothetical protein
MHPELAEQAYGWDASTVTAMSNEKMDWVCEKGHVWSAVVCNRSGGNGCPVCSGKKVLAGFNDLASTHPELAAQAHNWDPSTVSFGNQKKLEWICEKEKHLWSAVVASRTKGIGCPFCSGYRVLPGTNDLVTTNPELATQAHGWDPSTVTSWTHRKREWICEKGHVWSAEVGSRFIGGGCSVCAGKQVEVGYNDLATTNPELAAQAHGWDSTTVTMGSNKKFEWQCALGHVWSAVVSSRSVGNGCPVCAGQQVEVGFNDLATTNPELAAQAHGWDSTTVTAGTHRKRDWKCDEGHVWSAAVSSRSSVNGRGCPICSGNQVLAGYNDLATTNPELAAQAHGWDSTTVSFGSNAKRQWQCVLGHVWSAVVSSRSVGNGCPVCAGQQVEVGFNDLATTNPELATQAHGWNPSTVTMGSNKKFEWQCALGHAWMARVNHRTNGIGCPSCAESGFNPSKPGWLYLVESVERDMLQIGITNDLKRRLKEHARGHFDTVIAVTPYKIGQLAKDWESKILKYLRTHGAIIAKDAGIEKFDGYKESWLRASFPATSLKELRALVLDEEAAATDSIGRSVWP